MGFCKKEDRKRQLTAVPELDKEKFNY